MLLKRIILLVIPLAIATIIALILLNERYVFMCGGDPQYAYLLNGLTLAQGKMDIGYTDHPGTTVEIFNTLVIRLTFLFRSSDDLVNDVITNPELYLLVGRIIQILLIVICLIILGNVVLKLKNGNLGVALYMQLIPLSGVYIIMNTVHLAPEGLVIIGGIIMNIYCLKYLHTDVTDIKTDIRYAIVFGIICAFLIVTKFTAFVCVVLPLFMLPNLRTRLFFLGSFIVSIFIFILPAINRIHHFLSYIGKVATHQGIYGNGEEGVFDRELLFRNLMLHIQNDWFYFSVLTISIVISLYCFLFRKQFFSIHKKKILLLSGISLAMILNIVQASRNFGLHYLIPTQLLILLSIYLIVELCLGNFFSTYSFIKKWYITIPFATLLFVAFSIRFNKYYYFYPGIIQPPSKAHAILFNEKKLPRIYVCKNPGAPGPEPAFYFGWAFSGESRTLYAEYLQKNYPGAIMFEPTNNQYSGFGENWTYETIITKEPEYWYYFSLRDSTAAYSEMKRLINFGDSLGSFVNFTKVYRDELKMDEIYLMKCDTVRTNKRMPLVQTISCDFETTTGDSVSATTDNATIVNVKKTLDTGYSRSGKKSIHLTRKNAFGASFSLKAIPGSLYEITAWRYGNTSMGWITANAGPNVEFYQSSAYVTGREEQGWKEVKLKFIINKDFPYSDIHMILWNNDIFHHEMWFDDLTIKRFQILL